MYFSFVENFVIESSKEKKGQILRIFCFYVDIYYISFVKISEKIFIQPISYVDNKTRIR